MDAYKKKLLVLRQSLIGRRYHCALIALEFAMRYHTGLRKDKITPEFSHQIEIALFVLTLPDITYPEALLATIFLHDLREDYDISDNEIRALFNEVDFANRVSNAVENMTKVFRGKKKDEVMLFEAMADDPIASIAKPADRIHNFNTMPGVFSYTKQKEYVEEVNVLFFPMIKRAKRNFPMQTMAYENMKFVLTSQINMVGAIHNAAGILTN